MLRDKIRRLIIKAGLMLVISLSVFQAGSRIATNVYASNKYSKHEISQMIDLNKWREDKLNNIDSSKYIENNNTNTINSKDIKKESKGKILIYSSHSCEKNLDSTVVEVADNLKEKLERKGYIVEHDKSDFANMQGYNKAYYSSGAMLDNKNLNEYKLIIDVHFDSAPSPISTNVKDRDVAKLMFPNVSENPNLEYQTQLIEKIKEGLQSFSDNIYRSNTTNYRRGINFYNLHKNPNMLLIEVGGNNDEFLSCKRSMTYFSSAVDRALSE